MISAGRRAGVRAGFIRSMSSPWPFKLKVKNDDLPRRIGDRSDVGANARSRSPQNLRGSSPAESERRRIGDRSDVKAIRAESGSALPQKCGQVGCEEGGPAELGTGRM